MVKENRYVFDVKDIDRLIYECSTCGLELACKIKSQYSPLPHCVSCQDRLLEQDNMGPDPNSELLVELRRILSLSNPKVRLRFVVSEEGFTESKSD